VDRNNKKKAKRQMNMDPKVGQHAARAAQGDAEGMSPTLQAHIGRQVRAVFDEVAQEPVPDHLLKLLQDLDERGEK
jgi:anti-sigma factor NepR-like protein